MPMMTEDEERELAADLEQLNKRRRPGHTAVLFVFDQEGNEALVLSQIGVNMVVSLVVRWAMARLSDYVQLHEKLISSRNRHDA